MIRFFQFVILVLGLSLVALASAIVTMRFAIHGAEVTVPNFKNLTAQEALNKAAELGVEMSIDNRFYSAEVPAGRILAQSPPPGTVVRREWHVRAIESLGPQTVAIPNLVGQPERDATMRARRLGLSLGTVARMPFPAAPDTVVAQDPAAGAAGVEKPRVAVILADNALPTTAAFVMPDLVGLPYATAAQTLTRAGLKLAPEIDAPASTIPEGQALPQPGTVTAQTPEAGYRIDPNTPIQLTVAR
jgi:beta-lactam-binding protein with PASTA domain